MERPISSTSFGGLQSIVGAAAAAATCFFVDLEFLLLELLLRASVDVDTGWLSERCIFAVMEALITVTIDSELFVLLSKRSMLPVAAPSLNGALLE